MGLDEKKAIVLLGPPGSGKTSFANCLDKHNIGVIETGQLLRQQADDKTVLGAKLKSFLDSGKLAPTDLVVEVVDDAVKGLPAYMKVLVFDGFPRREDEIGPFLQLCHSNKLEFSADIILEISRRQL